jgi:hypothetical protein
MMTRMTITRSKSAPGSVIPLDEYFCGRNESRRIFEALRAAIEALGPSSLRVTRSQVAFVRRSTFARVWIPEQYLSRGAPLVLTLGFRRRDRSSRWKSIVEPSTGTFTHHLELFKKADIDDEVRAWLRKAWEAAA